MLIRRTLMEEGGFYSRLPSLVVLVVLALPGFLKSQNEGLSPGLDGSGELALCRVRLFHAHKNTVRVALGLLFLGRVARLSEFVLIQAIRKVDEGRQKVVGRALKPLRSLLLLNLRLLSFDLGDKVLKSLLIRTLGVASLAFGGAHGSVFRGLGLGFSFPFALILARSHEE